MIKDSAALRKFIDKHQLTHRQIGETLGYAVRPDGTCWTVCDMLAGEYNWAKNGLWVNDKLTKKFSK